MKYNPALPSVADFAEQARKRIPKFALDYLEAGIGNEHCLNRNRADLDNVLLWPRYLKDVASVDTHCKLFEHRYSLGIGVSPVGLGNLMWPDAERHLAQSAQTANIPYVCSTMGTTPLEQLAEVAPDVCWFQLYVPRECEAMRDLIDRVQRANYKVLVVTVDLPIGAKRDKELKNQLILPFRFTPQIIKQIMVRPRWALATLKYGSPKFVNVLRYGDARNINHLGEFLSSFFSPGVSLKRIKEIRAQWQGPLVVKGVQRHVEIEQLRQIGVDGVIVSNHGGRQLDAAPSSIETLRQIPERLHNDMTIMLDSGIRTGLDIVRARALGAKAAFSGRSFIYAIAGAGHDGGRQLTEIFRDEVTRTLQQLGCTEFESMDASWLKPD